MEKPLIIYHGSRCLDGFGSAFAAWHYYKLTHGVDADYHPAQHGENPPDCQDRVVYLLDYAYPRAQLAKLCKVAAKITVLDHHQSAQQNLQGLDDEQDNLELYFDMQRSGAVITWEHFHGNDAPALLAHIQDQDLWAFKLSDSKAINAALMSHPYDFELWYSFCCSEQALKSLIVEGEAINRFREQMILYYQTQAVLGRICGFEVPVVNAPMFINSELLNRLAEGHPFAASYTDTGHRRGWSLRSKEGAVNVANIASRYGGGGHPRAAGFSTEISSNLIIVETPEPGAT